MSARRRDLIDTGAVSVEPGIGIQVLCEEYLDKC
jgi:hypothetical protein